MDQQRRIGRDSFDHSLGRRGFQKPGQGVDALVDGEANLLPKLDEDGRISERDDIGFGWHLLIFYRINAGTYTLR